MTTHRWDDVRREKLSDEEIAEVDRAVADELLEMDLRAVRELLGLTQEQVAELAAMTQSEVSRMERRSDHRISTLRRVVESLGGELEVVANFGDKRVRLRAAG